MIIKFYYCQELILVSCIDWFPFPIKMPCDNLHHVYVHMLEQLRGLDCTKTLNMLMHDHLL